jgi:hypothetical protein
MEPMINEIPQVSPTEAELLGTRSVTEIDAWLGHALQQLTGAGLAEVVFRSGRIDAVFAVVATDARRLLIKVHRPPVDLETRRATSAAQGILARAGFPCAVPIAPTTVIDGRFVSVETLLEGGLAANGHDPAVRETIATTLADQIHLLQPNRDLVAAGHDAPAWCRYADGPWPTPHMSFFDFRSTPDGWTWLDEIARRAATQTLEARGDDEPAVAHADWYCGNLRFDGSRLVACFDWDLVTDTVSVLAGLTAGFHTHGTTEGAEQAEPAEVMAFLADFERAYGVRFDARQQRAAAGAATWSICYTARCHLQMLTGDPTPGGPLDALRRQGDAYLALQW